MRMARDAVETLRDRFWRCYSFVKERAPVGFSLCFFNIYLPSIGSATESFVFELWQDPPCGDELVVSELS